MGLKYQIPIWHQFGIGIPKSWYPIDVLGLDMATAPLYTHVYDVIPDLSVLSAGNISRELKSLSGGQVGVMQWGS